MLAFLSFVKGSLAIFLAVKLVEDPDGFPPDGHKVLGHEVGWASLERCFPHRNINQQGHEIHIGKDLKDPSSKVLYWF